MKQSLKKYSLAQMQAQRNSQTSTCGGFQSFKSMKNSKDYDIFMIYMHPTINKKVQACTVTLIKSNKVNYADILSWRSKTSLPIVKSYDYKVKCEDNIKIQLEIINEHIPQRLTSIPQLTLQQLLYFLKESLIGFDRLIERFGYFQPSSNLIGINQSKKCRVWFHENFHQIQNKPLAMKQSEFVSKFIKIFAEKVTHNTQATNLFKQLKLTQSIIKAQRAIDKFALLNKIIIPLKYEDKNKPVKSKSILEKDKIFTKNVSTKIINPQKRRTMVPELNMPVRSYSPLTKNNYNPQQKKSNISVHTPDVNSLYSKFTERVYTPTPKRHKRTPTAIQDLFGSQIQDNFLNNTYYQPTQLQRKTVKPQGYIDYISMRDNNLSVSKTFQDLNIPCKQSFTQKINSNLQSHEENSFLQKNGWQRKVDNLLSHGKDINQSFVDGVDERADLANFKLNLLGSFDINVVQSILPDQFDFKI